MALIAALWLGCAVESVERPVLVAASPLLSLDRDVDPDPWQGSVRERVEAGGYVYLDVGGRWVVGLRKERGGAPVGRVGDAVSVRTIGRASGFHSARTGRTFAQLDFAVVEPAL